MKKIDRTGEVGISNEGCVVKIVGYNSNKDIIVEFQDEHKYRTHTRYGLFKKGKCKNPFSPSVCGHGCLGVDKNGNVPETKELKDGKWVTTWEYHKWEAMLRRCFDNKYKERKPTYKDVTCCDRWLYFSYFLEDLEALKREYNWDNEEKLNLDKDILHKGNKTYSLEDCVLVPDWVNMLFTKCGASRGDYPIGVSYHKDKKKYQALCRVNGKQTRLGLYSTVEEAFNTYKTTKEQEIKRVAEDCVSKGYITKDSRLYKAMISYQVEIDD